MRYIRTVTPGDLNFDARAMDAQRTSNSFDLVGADAVRMRATFTRVAATGAPQIHFEYSDDAGSTWYPRVSSLMVGAVEQWSTHRIDLTPAGASWLGQGMIVLTGRESSSLWRIRVPQPTAAGATDLLTLQLELYAND